MIKLTIILLCLFIQYSYQEQPTTNSTTTDSPTQSTNSIRVRKPLSLNYTRKAGDRIRLECEFEISVNLNANDFTLYWVKNYQELLQTKKGFVHVIRKNMSSM